MSMGENMRKTKGDLSAPVLAIIVTIGIIAAGLVLVAWFWWFAPQAGKTGALVIQGQPVIQCPDSGDCVLIISIKNVGNDNVKLTEVYVTGYFVDVEDIELKAGEAKSLSILLNNIKKSDICTVSCPNAVEGVLMTTAGTYVYVALFTA